MYGKEKIRELFKKWQGGGPGGQVYVAHKGELVFGECFGYADIEHNELIGENTVFHVASVSKQITAMCVLILHERGLMDINNDIREYIRDLVAFSEPVTVKDLMNNISGIRDQWNLQVLSGVRLCDHITQGDLLELMGRQKSLNFPPRTQYMYSNGNFTLLAEIVERVSGVSLAKFANKNIFLKLDMKNTFFREKYDHLVPNRAMSYVDSWDGTYLWRPLSYSNYGATSLHTTGLDFLKWMKNLRNPVVCSEETLKTMLEVPKLDSDEKTTYACGINVSVRDDLGGRTVIFHGGADAGYRAMMFSVPEEQIDIAIFANVENLNVDALASKISEILLGIKNDVTIPEFDEKYYQDEVKNIDSLLGDYVYDTDVPVSLVKEGDVVRMLTGDNKRPKVTYLKGNCFEIENAPYKLYVNVDEMILSTGSASVRLGKMAAAVFSDDDLSQAPGIYFSPEVDSHFELQNIDGALFMRHKRLGKAPLMPVGDDIYSCRLEFPLRMSFVKNEGGDIISIKIMSGRITGILFHRILI